MLTALQTRKKEKSTLLWAPPLQKVHAMDELRPRRAGSHAGHQAFPPLTYNLNLGEKSSPSSAEEDGRG